MQATIDRSGCISCGLCAELCPEVFAIAVDGMAEVKAQKKAARSRSSMLKPDGMIKAHVPSSKPRMGHGPFYPYMLSSSFKVQSYSTLPLFFDPLTML